MPAPPARLIGLMFDQLPPTLPPYEITRIKISRQKAALLKQLGVVFNSGGGAGKSTGREVKTFAAVFRNAAEPIR